MTNISIVIPTLNEEQYIQECLESILNSDLNRDDIEILVVDGYSKDRTVDIVKEYIKKYPFIKLLHNPKKIIPSAMNIGIKNANSKYIIRIDAHSKYPKDYFSKLLYWSQKLDADNVGGVCITDVKNKNIKTQSIKSVLTSKLGAGGVSYKEDVLAPKESNTVPFGCFKKATFEKYGYFDERLERTEDLDLNKRFIDNGASVYLVPDVSFTYFAREKFRQLAKKSFETGRWVILSAYISKSFKALHIHHMIPFIFVLSLLLPIILCFVSKIFCSIFLFSLISYISVILYTSFRLKNKKNSFFYLVFTFIVLHISYGIGSLYGVLQIMGKYIKGRK